MSPFLRTRQSLATSRTTVLRASQLRRPSRGRTRAVALVTVLALVVIVSLILVAFVTAMRIERAASFSYSQSLAAEQIARGSLGLVTAELQNEMGKDALPNLDYPRRPVFTNVVSTNITPQLVGTNAAMPHLVKISSANPSFTGALASGKLLASGISSTAPANNGRYIDTNRWSLPHFGNFPDNASTPNWILVTRGGPTNTGTFGATGSTLNNSSLTNASYAIGRFAYAIYDESGLLDITVAGHPTSLTTAQIRQIKGFLAGALVAQTNFQVTPDALINWRNAASRSDYPSYVTNFLATNAPNAVFPGDNVFLSRQDLIKAAQAGIAGLTTNALPDITTFTRDRNAPSWGPTYNAVDLGGTNAAAYAYKSSANDPTAFNRFVPMARFSSSTTLTDYRNDGSSYTLSVVPGDAVIQRRFPLGRLNWVGPNGPQNGGTAAGIQACFGLIWGPSEDPDLNGASVWKYVGSIGASEQQTIKTLDQVASEKRLPDFFELLQAGILRGSLGVNRGGAWYNTQQNFPTLQILRIGAAMIDQNDTDSYPTVIEYKQSGDSWLACGVESLPNVTSIVPVAGAPQSPAQTVGETSATAATYLAFNLWNPHRQPASNPPPVRLRVKGSVSFYNYHGDSSVLSDTYGSKGEPGFLADLDSSIELSATGRQSFARSSIITKNDVISYNDSSALPPSNSTGIWANTYPLGTHQRTDVVALRLGNFPFALGARSRANPTDFTSMKVSLGYDDNSPFNAFMEFQSPSGAWIPYQFATGVNDPVSWMQSTGNLYVVSISSSGSANFVSYLGNYYPSNWSYNVNTGAVALSNIIYLGAANTWDRSLMYYYTSDPRSVRFNMWMFTRSGTNAIGAAEDSTLWSSTNNANPYQNGYGGDSSKVQGKPASIGSLYYPAQLARNNFGRATAISESNNSVTTTGNGTDTSYADYDGLRRVADSGLFVDTSGTTGNPFERAVDRPLVLNSAFRNVGELGFAFRDDPWRSLDFFSGKSADSALLDLFTIQDTTNSTVSGRINLNSGSPTALNAILDGTVSDPVTGTSIGASTSIASAIAQYTVTNKLINKSELASVISPLLSPTTGGTTSPSFVSNDEQNIKYRREAFVRGLADVGQTRTWNLMIDLIAQSGHFSPAASSLDKFTVDGERRVWLHIAIDRITGDVLDTKLEVVTE